jgi:hypothetical protein
MVGTREKGRGAIWESTGSYFSLVLLVGNGGGDVTRGKGVDRVEGGMGEQPHPQKAGPKIPSRLNAGKKVAISSL